MIPLSRLLSILTDQLLVASRRAVKVLRSDVKPDIYISGYEIVRRDRVTNGHNGGGVCFFIHSNLNYNIRQDLQHEKLEFLAVEINNPHSKPFLVSTWYRPQRTPWPVPEIFRKY